MRLFVQDLRASKIADLSGEIEVDESYFSARRVKGQRGRGALTASSTPMVGVVMMAWLMWGMKSISAPITAIMSLSGARFISIA